MSLDPKAAYEKHRSFCVRTPNYCTVCRNLRAALASWEAQQAAAGGPERKEEPKPLARDAKEKQP